MSDQPTGLAAETLAEIEKAWKSAQDRPCTDSGGPSSELLLCRAALWLNAPALFALAREAMARRNAALVYANEALRARLRESEARNVDDPQWDATDAALPAWWRGHDHGANAVIRRLRDAVDGKDDGAGVMAGGLERLRRDILKLRESEARLKLAEAVWEFVPSLIAVAKYDPAGDAACKGVTTALSAWATAKPK